MAMFVSQELEALETCPYNVSHRISAKRFATHLVRCRKANPNVEMVTCPLYAEHKIPKPEYAYHIAICTKKKELDKEVFQEETRPTKFEVQGGPIQVESEETWDIHDGPSYNPQVYCEQNPVIRQAKVESASIRKNFRQSERQRHQMLSRQEHEKAAKRIEKAAVSETSEREDSTTSDAQCSLSEQLSRLSVNEAPTTVNNEWVKIRGRRGRGGAGKRM